MTPEATEQTSEDEVIKPNPNALAQPPTSKSLILARHIVGMMIVAVGYTEIYLHPSPVLAWVVTWTAPLIFGAVVAGLYLLFFTKHARGRWGKVLIAIAWAFILIVVLSSWSDAVKQKQTERELLQKFRGSQMKDGGSQGQRHHEKWWDRDPIVKGNTHLDLFEYFGVNPPSKPGNANSHSNPFDQFDKHVAQESVTTPGLLKQVPQANDEKWWEAAPLVNQAASK